MRTDKLTIRPINENDDAGIAAVIRTVLSEFSADKPGTVFFDPTTDHLSAVFKNPASHYWIAEEEGRIVGGAGIFPTDALPAGYCELVKLYLLPELRGKGIGKRLIKICIAAAKEEGFTHMYLESMPELSRAVALYEHLGFQNIQAPLGNSGHFGCDIWMVKKL